LQKIGFIGYKNKGYFAKNRQYNYDIGGFLSIAFYNVMSRLLMQNKTNKKTFEDIFN